MEQTILFNTMVPLTPPTTASALAIQQGAMRILAKLESRITDDGVIQIPDRQEAIQTWLELSNEALGELPFKLTNIRDFETVIAVYGYRPLNNLGQWHEVERERIKLQAADLRTWAAGNAIRLPLTPGNDRRMLFDKVEKLIGCRSTAVLIATALAAKFRFIAAESHTALFVFSPK